MHRTVVLEHILPDGSAHFDWMIEDPALGGEEHRLACWRTDQRPDLALSGFWGERIGSHRAAYLTFEGPVSGDRGRVRRLASGAADWDRAGADRVVVRVRWETGRITRFQGEARNGPWWHFGVRVETALDARPGL